MPGPLFCLADGSPILRAIFIVSFPWPLGIAVLTLPVVTVIVFVLVLQKPECLNHNIGVFCWGPANKLEDMQHLFMCDWEDGRKHKWSFKKINFEKSVIFIIIITFTISTTIIIIIIIITTILIKMIIIVIALKRTKPWKVNMMSHKMMMMIFCNFYRPEKA